MTPFEVALSFVLQHEGGFVDDPADPGGRTKYGISQLAYPAMDIAGLTLEKAGELYRRDYWNACRCGELPSPLAIAVFDSAVNQGTDAAIRMLQESLGVHVDGKIGPVTLKAAASANLKTTLVNFVAARAMRYATNKNLALYGRGWFHRLAACHQAALEPL